MNPSYRGVLFLCDFLTSGQIVTGTSKVFVCTGDGTIRTFSEEGGGESVPVSDKDFTYSGDYQIIDDSSDSAINWRIKFLTSGTFKPLRDMIIDAFLVGGGGGCCSVGMYTSCGGGGYTKTEKSIILSVGTEYEINVGLAGGSQSVGGTSSAFNSQVLGGNPGTAKASVNGEPVDRWFGGNGGSGGAGESGYSSGIDGGNGGAKAGYAYWHGGTGQGTTTREFSETTGDLYSTGGGNSISAVILNSGNGSRNTSINAASGIVIIRKHRE